MGKELARVEGFPAPAGPVDLVLRRGMVVRLSGRNGSGKTSLLRNLAGLPAPMAAKRAALDGAPPASLPATALAQRIGVVHQDARDGLVGLTVAGEYRFRGQRVPPDAGARDVATLSSGEARRLALRLARGPVLLLDEPAEGLDAQGIAMLRARIVDAAHDGCVVLVDHEGVLADLADRHIVLESSHPPAAWIQPAPGDAVVLTAGARRVPLERDIALPDVALPAGLHVVTGPNGSGKSTLLRSLAGLHGEPAQVCGRAARPGQDVRWLSPQADDHLRHASVAQELERVSRGTPGAAGWAHGDARTARHEIHDPVAQALARLVPAALDDRHPFRLSGGERKRVALGKVLGRAAPVYLLDEPEAHLDAQGRDALQALVAARISQGSVVLAATHDAGITAAAHWCIRLEAP